MRKIAKPLTNPGRKPAQSALLLTKRGPARGPRPGCFYGRLETCPTAGSMAGWKPAPRTENAKAGFGYPRRGLKITVAKGGKITWIDAGRPWCEKASACTPGPLPRLLPP